MGPILIFGFALGIRLSLSPYFQNLQLSGDEIYYWSSARVVAGGHLTKNFLHPPLWTYVLSIPSLIYDNIFYGRLFTTIISSFSAPLIYFLGKHVFNRKVGITAGVIYSIYPNILGFSHYLWTETLLSLLILLSTYLFFKTIDDKTKHAFLYLSFFISSLALLVKEFGIIHFGSIIVALFSLSVINKKQLIIRAIMIFLTPVIIYSAFASFLAQRPVMLADAFVYNSNEADYGKNIWKKSTKDNLKIFIDRLFMLREIPARFARQIHNLWTPNSFLIFRLLYSPEKYTDVLYSRLIAYITAGMYISIIVFGLTGMICDEKNLFKVFAVANLLFLSSTGLLFLMCSRFRIPFIYIFIIYSSVVLSNPMAVLRKITWRKSLILLFIFTIFVNIIYEKMSSFGYWG
ncbi:MAG: glycosyltransferase family 39 protein [Candidatus Hodarchaeota archaeon]